MSQDRMKWQQAGATLGVIISLVFVGYEIRQNTNVARAAAVQAISEQVIQWQKIWLTPAVIAGLILILFAILFKDEPEQS